MKGRPRKEIDKREFEKLCGLQCTHDEICGWFDVTHKTLEAWCKREYGETFSQVFAQKRGTGKIALRRMQFQLAAKSASMAIFLGKNYLDQKDTPFKNDPEALRNAKELLEGIESAID